MKSIRSTPSVHGEQGDERIRTAELALGTDPVYEDGGGLNADVAQIDERLGSLSAGPDQGTSSVDAGAMSRPPSALNPLGRAERRDA